MPTLAVYLDQDGVLADFNAGKVRHLGADAPDTNRSRRLLGEEAKRFKDRLYASIREDREFYYTLPLMPGALQLIRAMAPYLPQVLTAAPSVYHGTEYFGVVESCKWRWLEQDVVREVYAFAPQDFICTLSHDKPKYLGHRREADHHLLIDDRLDNCEAWIAAGGLAIRYTTVQATLHAFDILRRQYGAFTPPIVRAVA